MFKRIFLVLYSFLLSSCSIIDIQEEVHYSYDSGRIAQPMLGKVVPGTTTRQWLLEHFGEPNLATQIDESTERLTYLFDEHVNQRTRILFLFKYQSKKVVPRELDISLKDNVVTRIGPSYFEDKEDL